MKLNTARSYFESSPGMKENYFSIGDLGIVFDILRSKLYSNPILAICKEISCNARDTHREVGHPDLPISIHLPSGLDPNFKIKDFGLGISPSRIEDVFIKYASSTKRDDNIQVGSFGIGSKTPFSYSDSFSVVTIFNNIKYHYACVIDDTKIGKLLLLNEEDTLESNGTEISVPVKSDDFKLFAQYTEQACRHWPVKPAITGGKIEWTSLVKVIEGNKWSIANDEYNNTPQLIIDGIEYPCEIQTLKKYTNTDFIGYIYGKLFMYFDTGEISLSANREQIYWDKLTQDAIIDRLNNIKAELAINLKIKIENFKNLWDAQVFYKKELSKIFNNLSFLGTINWRGCPLYSGYSYSLQCPVTLFDKGKYSYKLGKNDPDKISGSIGRSIDFVEGSELWINDLPVAKITPKHVRKAFENNPKLRNIQVICPTDAITEEVLNKTYNLDKMEPKRLSSICTATAKINKVNTKKLLVFKYFSGSFRQVSYSSMEEDKNTKIIAKLKKEDWSPYDRYPLISGIKNMNNDYLASLKEIDPSISLYGLDDSADPIRVNKEFGKFKTLDDHIQEVLSKKDLNFIEVKIATNIFRYGHDDFFKEHYDYFNSHVKDKSGLMFKIFALHSKYEELNNYRNLIRLHETTNGEITQAVMDGYLKNNPEFDIKEIGESFFKKYPMIKSINKWSINELLEHLALYINMVDSL